MSEITEDNISNDLLPNHKKNCKRAADVVSFIIVTECGALYSRNRQTKATEAVGSYDSRISVIPICIHPQTLAPGSRSTNSATVIPRSFSRSSGIPSMPIPSWC